MASASPMASAAVVLEVGASLSRAALVGHAHIQHNRSGHPQGRSRIARQGDERHPEALQMWQQQHDLGRLAGVGESAMTRSVCVIIPRSPWTPSAGWRK